MAVLQFLDSRSLSRDSRLSILSRGKTNHSRRDCMAPATSLLAQHHLYFLLGHRILHLRVCICGPCWSIDDGESLALMFSFYLSHCVAPEGCVLLHYKKEPPS